jgi:hypothetical protein
MQYGRNKDEPLQGGCKPVAETIHHAQLILNLCKLYLYKFNIPYNDSQASAATPGFLMCLNQFNF